MSFQWLFSKVGRGFVNKTSHEDEFFNNTSGVEALVREAAQNSMDAALDGHTSVKLRLAVERCQSSGKSSELFQGLQEHLSATGINISGSLGGAGFPFLVIEDFGTTGLGGDVEPNDLAVNQGDFYNFWWSDGTMKKGGRSGGRWGLGKYTFFMSSKIKSFWGLTINGASSTSYLMGRALLKTHQIDGDRYNIDGFYSDNFYPITDESTTDDFRRLFALKRDIERGLSLVIPFPVGDITRESIELAVMKHCMYPIICGKMQIELQDETSLDSSTLPAFIRTRMQFDSSYSVYEELWQFFTSCYRQPPDVTLSISNPELPKITEDSFLNSLLNESDLDDIRKRYSQSSGSFIKVRIPITIRFESGRAFDTHYDVSFYRRKDIERQKVFCFRSGVSVIEGIRANVTGGYVTLVAEDPVMAEFLGDAENPSHTEWKENEALSKKYPNSKLILKFVKDSVRQITNVLDKAPETVYDDVLSDVFYIEDEETKGRKRRRKTTFPPLPRTPSLLDIEKKAGGFSLRFGSNPGSAADTLPQQFRVTVAYMVRRGNPFSRYEENDFDLSGADLAISSPSGGRVLSRALNQLKVEVSSSDFSLEVTGFDPHRDLAVKVTRQQAVSAS